MDIEEIRKRKSAIEKSLLSLLQKEAEDLRAQSGCFIKGVDVRMTDVTSFSDTQAVLIISSVSVKINTGLEE